MDYLDCPRGKVALWPPNGGQEPTFFLERHVSQQLNRGWTLEPKRPERPKPPEPQRSSTPRRSNAATTDKPKLEQGTEEAQ